jgi:hypothetical protein
LLVLSVRFPENIDGVKEALQRSHSKSISKTAARLGILRQLMQQILKRDLNLYPYKMTVLPKVTVQKNVKERYLLNGLRIKRYRSTMFGFLMRHSSTWMLWIINGMCDVGHQTNQV